MTSAERIVAHMNHDRQLALYDLLFHYAQVDLDPDCPSTCVELVSVGLDHLVLQYTTTTDDSNAKEVRVPVEPPMQDLSEARTTLGRMARTAAASRGCKPHRVTHFDLPTAPLSVLLILGTLANIPFLRALILNRLAPRWAAQSVFIKSVTRYPWALLAGILAAHGNEAVWLMWPRMHVWRVPMPQRGYWVATTMGEGYQALRRFDAITRKLEQQDE